MTEGDVVISDGGLADVEAVMIVMEDSFDPRFGEAWTASQCAGLLPMQGVWLTLARDPAGPIGFALARQIADEAELLLLAVRRIAQHRGVGKRLLEHFETTASDRGARR